MAIPSLLLSEIKVRSYNENDLRKEEGGTGMVPYISTIEWKPFDGKQLSEVRSAPRVRRSKAREHPFGGQVKRDHAPQGAEERSDGALSSQSNKARSPPGANERSG